MIGNICLVYLASRLPPPLLPPSFLFFIVFLLFLITNNRVNDFVRENRTTSNYCRQCSVLVDLLVDEEAMNKLETTTFTFSEYIAIFLVEEESFVMEVSKTITIPKTGEIFGLFAYCLSQEVLGVNNRRDGFEVSIIIDDNDNKVTYSAANGARMQSTTPTKEQQDMKKCVFAIYQRTSGAISNDIIMSMGEQVGEKITDDDVEEILQLRHKCSWNTECLYHRLTSNLQHLTHHDCSFCRQQNRTYHVDCIQSSFAYKLFACFLSTNDLLDSLESLCPSCFVLMAICALNPVPMKHIKNNINLPDILPFTLCACKLFTDQHNNHLSLIPFSDGLNGELVHVCPNGPNCKITKGFDSKKVVIMT